MVYPLFIPCSKDTAANDYLICLESILSIIYLLVTNNIILSKWFHMSMLSFFKMSKQKSCRHEVIMGTTDEKASLFLTFHFNFELE